MDTCIYMDTYTCAFVSGDWVFQPFPSSSFPEGLSAFLMNGSLRESLKLLLKPRRASFSDEARPYQQQKFTHVHVQCMQHINSMYAYIVC